MFLRGSNQNIGYGTVTGTYPGDGNPGIRQIGNMPEVPTSPGQPANVYIHDNNIQSGDAVYQACQPLQTSLWTNVSSNDIFFQNNTGSASNSALLLIGERAVDATPGHSNWTCSNIKVDHMTGTGGIGGRAVLISAGNYPNAVSNVTITNSTMSASASTSTSPAFTVGTGTGTISNVTVNNVTLNNANKIALSVVGNVSDFSYSSGVIGTPVVGGQPTVFIQGSTRATISNTSIGSNGGDAIKIDSNGSGSSLHAALQPTISGNTLSGIGNNRSGVNLLNVSSGSIMNNVMQQVSGATRSIGITFSAASSTSPGTINTSATGNDVSLMTNNPTIKLAGTGNTATGNTGYSGPSTPTQASYSVKFTKVGTGKGTVTSIPALISCGAACPSGGRPFPAGSQVTLVATPAKGSVFAGWSGACSGTGACVLTITGPQSVTVTFN
jgi:hypothetical protein